MASKQKKQSKLAQWHGSYQGKRTIGSFYSVGAAMVLLGALFKIMNWPYGGIILSVGMLTEVVIFLVSAFDKPFKEYDWDKVFSFQGDGSPVFHGSLGTIEAVPVLAGAAPAAMPAPRAAAASSVPSVQLSDAEAAAMSEGVKNLSSTAQQLAALSSSIGSAAEFAKNIESATEQYAGRFGDINKNLSSLNSVYEIQLRNMQAQSDAISKQLEMILSQTEHTRVIGENLNEIAAENQKIRLSTKTAAEETDRYREASVQLANQVADLNKVYGNMLNALS